MAGGDANDLRAPWPKGDDGLMMVTLPIGSCTGVTGAKTLAQFTLPFKCECVYAEWTAGVFTDADTDATLTIQDDTGTPKKWVNAGTLGASYALGASVARALTVVKNIQFFAGSLVSIIFTPGDSADTITDGSVTLWLKPIHG